MGRGRKRRHSAPFVLVGRNFGTPQRISGWGVYGAFGDVAPAFEVVRQRGQARWNYV